VPLWRPELSADSNVPTIGQQTTNPDAPWGGVGRKP
jgi:hypothetical protein